MSRLYFRSRALDIHKALPIYLSSGIRDLSECSTINRDVPLMPTGMEKEEENETHFQLALIAQKRKISNVPKFVYKENIIPTPKVDLVTLSHSETEIKILDDDCIYFKINLFEDVTTDHLSEYDMDSDDEAWLSAHESYGISHKNFEHIISTFQSSSNYDLTKIDCTLLQTDADISESLLLEVYEYWFRKARKIIHPSAISFTETPYSAFRKRNDRMITRRFRKFDEQNYEKLDQFEKTFQLFNRITELIYTREILKNKLISLLKTTFSQRNRHHWWKDVPIYSSDSQIDTYFDSTPCSFTSTRIWDSNRTNPSKNQDIQPNFPGVMQIHSHEILGPKFTKLSYISADLINDGSSVNLPYLSAPDGKFSFVSNDSSKYFPPSKTIDTPLYPVYSGNDNLYRSINRYYRKRSKDSKISNHKSSDIRSIITPLERPVIFPDKVSTISCSSKSTLHSIFRLH